MSASVELTCRADDGTTLTPGAVLSAIALGTKLSSEDVLTMTPIASDVVTLMLAPGAASRIATPKRLVVYRDGRPSQLVLTRDTDLPGAGPGLATLEWDGGEGPTPSALSRALARASDGSVGGDELGVVWPGGSSMLATLPAWWIDGADTRTFDADGLAITGASASKKKSLAFDGLELASPPDAWLEAIATSARAALDERELGPEEVRERVAAASHALLARFPTDKSLWNTHVALRELGFVPPRPLIIPTGDVYTVWTALEALPTEERARLSEGLIALPGTDEPERARATLELLVQRVTDGDPQAAGRAEELLARIADQLEPATAALFRVRLDAASQRPADADAWRALVERCFATVDEGRREHATALTLAASDLLATACAEQPLGPVAVLGGRRIANLALTILRHPSRLPALQAVVDLVAEADAMSRGSRHGGLDGLLARVEGADRAGDFESGSELLRHAWRDSGQRTDVGDAMVRRGWLLLDSALAGTADPNAGADISEVARRDIQQPPPVDTTTVPAMWVESLAAAHAGGDGSETLRLLHQAGASALAASRWLARGDDEGLLAAFSLRRHLTTDEQSALNTALDARAPRDDARLTDPTERALTVAALNTCVDDAQRRLWRTRLIATAQPVVGPAVPPDEDPHAPTNRLAAAIDLSDEGRVEAAGAVVVALLKKRDLSGSLLRRVAVLTARLLGEDDPPAELVVTAGRLLERADAGSAALLQACADDPLGAYPLHEALVRQSSNAEHPDAHRLASLQAWLAIWRATNTPPDTDVLATLGRARVLAALAAARLSGVPDPVAAALAFDEEYPAHRTAATELARALLALSQPA